MKATRSWVVFFGFFSALCCAAQVTTQTPYRALYDGLLNGSVSSNLDHTLAWFEWGTGINYGNVTERTELPQSSNTVTFQSFITNLTAYGTYHYRALASNILGQVTGADVSFMTVPRLVQTTAPIANWTSIASSADGRKLAASAGGPIYVSTNAGLTWTLVSGAGTYLVSSADGTKLIASGSNSSYPTYAPGPFSISTNGGATWTTNNAVSLSWVACSADAKKLVATDNAWIYTSTNNGASWTKTSAPNLPWARIGSSADGNRLVAAKSTWNPRNQTAIYASSDSGSSWSNKTSFPDAGVTSVITSSDGSRILVLEASSGYNFLTSTNSGASWVPQDTGIGNLGAACSGDGLKLVIANSYILTSTDFGATRIEAEAPPQDWYSVASSDDGAHLAAVANPGGIYVSQLTVAPTLKISAFGNQTEVSWSLPSTNYILQQAFDLMPTN